MNINLWCGPRNISTALMYAFAQRADTQVFDEPLYAHYLRTSGAQHPGRNEILGTQNPDGEQVIQDIILAKGKQPVRVYKQMTHHLIDISRDFLTQTRNIIVIRHPEQVLRSYAKVIATPTLADIGIRQSAELLRHLQANNCHVAVIDSQTLLSNPAHYLPKLCQACGILPDTAMLQWPAGPRPEDGIWAKYWYQNVHKSTHLQPFPKDNTPLAPHLAPILAQAMPYYEQLTKIAII